MLTSRLKVILLGAVAIATACDERGNGSAATDAGGARTVEGRDGSVDSIDPPAARAVCFLPNEPPTATARYAADDAGTDAGSNDAGAETRVVEVDIDWTRSYIAIEWSESASGVVLLDHATTDDHGRLMLAVPVGAQTAQVSLTVSCNPHLSERVSILLLLHPNSVDPRIQVGY
jgi:hypothetical protein